jgi:hypothetical protein
MFSLRKIENGTTKVLIESHDYMNIVEYLLSSKMLLNDKQTRRMFFNISTKGRHKFDNGSIIELKNLLF